MLFSIIGWFCLAQLPEARLVKRVDPDSEQLVVYDGNYTHYLHLDPTKIVWHQDVRVSLRLSELQPGVLLYPVDCDQFNTGLLRVSCLGPYGLEAAVEQWVIEVSRAQPHQVLSPQQLAVVEALGSMAHLVREGVTEQLRKQRFRALRLLLWARQWPDEEVKVRAELLLRELGWVSQLEWRRRAWLLSQ